MVVLNMMREIHRHMNDEELEKYSMGRIAGEDAAGLEEHLLVCQSCRERLEGTDDFAAGMRQASAEFRRQTPEREPWRWRLTRLAPVLAAAILVIALAVLAVQWYGTTQPLMAVNLSVTRTNGSEAVVPAGRRLLLNPDLTGLPPEASYKLEVVDQDGARVWQGDFAPASGATLPRQRAGMYFVRVYSSAGVLLREYGLRAVS